MESCLDKLSGRKFPFPHNFKIPLEHITLHKFHPFRNFSLNATMMLGIIPLVHHLSRS